MHSSLLLTTLRHGLPSEMRDESRCFPLIKPNLISDQTCTIFQAGFKQVFEQMLGKQFQWTDVQGVYTN